MLRRAGAELLRRCSSSASTSSWASRCSTATASSSLDETVLRITPSAVARLKDVAKPGQRLRVEVDSGGCSGFEYKFVLEQAGEKQLDGDRVFSQDGAEPVIMKVATVKMLLVVQVVVDALSLDLMRGSTLDYTEELIRSAFRITANPLAEKGCSCGSSFALRMD